MSVQEEIAYVYLTLNAKTAVISIGVPVLMPVCCLRSAGFLSISRLKRW